MRSWVLIAMLSLAPVASANGFLSDDHSVNNTANGGKADADANSVAFGGSSKVDTDVDVKNTNVNTAVSGAASNQDQGQQQGQLQGISAFNGNTTTVEAPDVKGMGRELAKHASSAAEVHSNSTAVNSPCGDSTGLSAQAGVFGGGFATVSETCRAARLQSLQAADEKAVSTTLAEITYFVGWFPRLVLHVASFGVLN